MSSGRHILYVTESYKAHDRRFLEAIGKQTEKIWFANTGRSPLSEAIILPAPVSLWPGIGQPISTWQKLIDHYDIHTVHAGPLDTVLPVIAGHIDRPLVGMSWGSDILVNASKNVAVREQLIRTLNKVDALIVDCSAVINKLMQWVPDLSIPCIQFPWGVDLNRFETLPEVHSLALRERMGWKDKIVIISTRSWSVMYGIPTLIEAFSLLSKKLPDARLILIGDGDLRENVLSQIKHLQLGDKVHCPGRLEEEELPLWYGAADIYVSSSLSDGSSVSLLEAMACGLPVIVHREHGNLEWVTDKENGLLVNCKEPEKISDVILRAVKSRDLLQKMGRANRKKIVDKADWHSNSRKIIRAYDLAHEHYLLKKSAHGA